MPSLSSSSVSSHERTQASPDSALDSDFGYYCSALLASLPSRPYRWSRVQQPVWSLINLKGHVPLCCSLTSAGSPRNRFESLMLTSRAISGSATQIIQLHGPSQSLCSSKEGYCMALLSLHTMSCSPVCSCLWWNKLPNGISSVAVVSLSEYLEHLLF